MPFAKLGLHTSIVRAVAAKGYTTPSPIQEQAIPVVLTGRDLIASAQTGTGKTAAFALPILNRLGPHKAAGPRVLVLEPTRELAAQVDEAFAEFGQFTDARRALLHGGVGYGKQRSDVRAGADIVIATVGRLMDFLQERALRLDHLEILVLDEVDRMLDMGFINDVKKIVAMCPPNRQTLFFSATVPPEIEAIARFALKNPERISIGRQRSVNESVTHAIYPVPMHLKFPLLLALLEKTDFHSVIVFTRTKHGADKIAKKLKSEGHSVAVLHGNRSQGQRKDALTGFKEGRYEVMVATDIAARGLDVAGVTHVINYDIPGTPDDYVHRIGRTGRAAAEGDAFTLVSPDQTGEVRAIEKFIKATIPQLQLEGFDYKAKAIAPAAGTGQGERESHYRDPRAPRGGGRSSGGSGGGRGPGGGSGFAGRSGPASQTNGPVSLPPRRADHHQGDARPPRDERAPVPGTTGGKGSGGQQRDKDRAPNPFVQKGRPGAHWQTRGDGRR
ncbi:MAG: DEAD/DEAH box helicase [Verrucomicrobia bacterium]|nr:DEAD/DEAH box helicase [Verrucomicrobiota bacterium]